MNSLPKGFRPMKGEAIEPEQLDKLRYPVYVSPKLDGIRCLKTEQGLLSYSLKPIPNKFTQERFKDLPVGFDGELIVGDPADPDCYRKTCSAVMSRDGEPDVHFYAFDMWNMPSHSFSDRLVILYTLIRCQVPTELSNFVKGVDRLEVSSESLLLSYEEIILSWGCEGIIIRDPEGFYKHGRSTIKQQWMLKLKRFTDDEALIVGAEEAMENRNEATINEHGLTERSSHKANQVGKGRLGALVVEWKGIRFNIGSGFTHEESAQLWADYTGKPVVLSVKDSSTEGDDATVSLEFQPREPLVGQLVKFKYQPTGIKEAPRFPTYLGLRSKLDV